jgi:predicted patatin/cPLA2 family phospholipase
MPGNRHDGAKLGLAIEGGGMRGVVSAGMVAALESIGLLHCFDSVYGSSAGSINGAYFIAGQARYGTTIYYQDINNTRFINVKRLFGDMPVLSLEFLLDTVAETIKPLDWDKIIDSPTPLVAVASSLTHGHAVHLSSFEGKNDLKECLRASARIPVIAGRPVEHRGMRLWDALVFEPIPINAGIEDKCTHMLVLLTRPARQAYRNPRSLQAWFIAHLIGRESAAAKRAYLSRAETYNKTLQDVLNGIIQTNAACVSCLAVQIPETAPLIKGTESDSNTLIAAARAGFRAVYATLGLKVPQIVEVLTAFELL